MTAAVPTRRISFDQFGDVPKHFTAEGDLISSHIVASLSSLFPDGEDFFVRSVRHFRKDVEDPELKKQVAGFIGQEAIHGREHRELNTKLAELGYPTKLYERITAKGLALRTKLAPPKANLAATAALEHFTATLAEALLTKPAMRDALGHGEVRNLFTWHALEESEHKAVAFDVYRLVGGSERLRVWTMKFLRFGFLLTVIAQTLGGLLTDRSTYHPKVLLASLRRLPNNPLLDKELWEQLKDYDRPDFHPDDRDTTELVAIWRAELFGEAGTLNGKLAGASAA